MKPDIFIGLMSGTSTDGIDAVAAEFSDGGCRVLHHLRRDYPPELRTRLRAAAVAPAGVDLVTVSELDVLVAQCFAHAATDLLAAARLAAADITALGSHGQTVLHLPDAAVPRTFQLGDPGAIAALTGMTVVADFRRADVALGGQGAPLVPGFHAAMFRRPGTGTAAVNIGGIANVTLLPDAGPVRGFDTGPGNTLLDAWCELHLGQPFDAGGRWAAGGRVLPDLLTRLQADPYFSRPPPKSTGVDYFNLAWLHRHLAAHGGTPDPRDVQATLANLTALEIARGALLVPNLARAVICGGGSHNTDLLARLHQHLPAVQVETSDAAGIPPDLVEATAFAWLARQRLLARPSNLPDVTGARQPVALGGVYLPPA